MTKKTKRSILWIPQNKKSRHAGIHLIAEFWHGKIIENPEEVERILIKATKEAGNIPLEVAIHKFSPRGITGVVLLAESHIALHAWPEIDYLAIDIFTCGERAMPDKALNYLKKIFKPKRAEVKKIKRGVII